MAGQLQAVHARHFDIGKHHIDHLPRGQDGQRRLAAGHQRDDIAEFTEHFLREGAHFGVVLHHQDAGSMPGGHGRRQQRHWFVAAVFDTTVEKQGKRGSHARRAVDRDLAARLLGKAEHLRQAQARALARRLGGKERLEDTVEMVLPDSAARVGDRNRHETALPARMGAHLRYRALLADGNGNAPALNDGVARVDDHVDDHGIELARIGVHETGVSWQDQFDLDARADQGADHVADAGDGGANVERFRLQGLPARKRQQLRRQPGSAVGRVGNGGNKALAPFGRQVRQF